MTAHSVNERVHPTQDVTHGHHWHHFGLAPLLPHCILCELEAPEPTTPAINLESTIGRLRNWQLPATHISEDLGLAATARTELPETVK